MLDQNSSDHVVLLSPMGRSRYLLSFRMFPKQTYKIVS